MAETITIVLNVSNQADLNSLFSLYGGIVADQLINKNDSQLNKDLLSELTTFLKQKCTPVEWDGFISNINQQFNHLQENGALNKVHEDIKNLKLNLS